MSRKQEAVEGERRVCEGAFLVTPLTSTCPGSRLTVEEQVSWEMPHSLEMLIETLSGVQRNTSQEGSEAQSPFPQPSVLSTYVLTWLLIPRFFL